MQRRSRWLGLGGLIAIILLLAPGTGPAVRADRAILVTLKTDTITACSVLGAGECTLRDAIILANAEPGFDHIRFSFIGEGVHIINISQPLPALTDPAGTFIDGYSQTDSVRNSATVGTNADLKIRLHGSGIFDGLRLDGENNMVQGLSITGFGGVGIVIDGENNSVAGNFIGMTPAGIGSGNGGGVYVESGSGATRIGGNQVSERNLISSNSGTGIRVDGETSFGTIISNNIIGAGKEGLAGWGNSAWGIHLNGSTDTIITGNVIAHNGGGGVAIHGDGAVRNRVQRNEIFLNGGLGIDIGPVGMNSNDAGDADEGPNRLQNAPVLTGAYRSAATGALFVSGTVDGNPLAKATDIEVYRADITGAGPGEGRFPIHFKNAAGSGSFTFHLGPFTPAVAESVGSYVSALATSTDGTSEFSLNVPIVANTPPVADPGPHRAAAVGVEVVLDGSDSTDADGKPVPLTYFWSQLSGPAVDLAGRTSSQLSFTPPQGGEYVFELVVSDGLDESQPEEVNVTVGDLNPPQAMAQTVSVKSATPKPIRLVGVDSEHSELTFALVERPEHGSIGGFSEESGVAIYTARAGFSGIDSFTFTVSDGVHTSAPATVTIVVDGGLAITAPTVPTAVLGAAYSFAFSASGGNAPYTWTASPGDLPAGLALNPQGVLSGIPSQVGSFTFELSVTDGTGRTSAMNVHLAVAAPNDHPYRIFAILSASE